jgi:hypothetical protein
MRRSIAGRDSKPAALYQLSPPTSAALSSRIPVRNAQAAREIAHGARYTPCSEQDQNDREHDHQCEKLKVPMTVAPQTHA